MKKIAIAHLLLSLAFFSGIATIAQPAFAAAGTVDGAYEVVADARGFQKDTNGDGKADVAIHDKQTGDWFVGRSTGSSFAVSPFATNFGNRGRAVEEVFVGDFSGDGKADVAIHNQGTGDWFTGRFTVEIDGVVIEGIRKVSGLKSETEVVEYKDGEDRTIHTRPGNHKPGRISITKDFSPTDKMFFKWRQSVINGKTERKSISVIFHNDAGEESTRVNLFDCYPTKWKGPSLNARTGGHASEVITIRCERMELR